MYDGSALARPATGNLSGKSVLAGLGPGRAERVSRGSRCLAAHVVLRAGPNRADRPRAALGRGRDGGQGSHVDKGADKDLATRREAADAVRLRESPPPGPLQKGSL